MSPADEAAFAPWHFGSPGFAILAQEMDAINNLTQPQSSVHHPPPSTAARYLLPYTNTHAYQNRIADIAEAYGPEALSEREDNLLYFQSYNALSKGRLMYLTAKPVRETQPLTKERDQAKGEAIWARREMDKLKTQHQLESQAQHNYYSQLMEKGCEMLLYERDGMMEHEKSPDLYFATPPVSNTANLLDLLAHFQVWFN